jgi:hypothetical protein
VKKNSVFIIGIDGSDCAQHIHRQLHYCVPESATSNPDINTLFVGGKVINREAAPLPARMRQSTNLGINLINTIKSVFITIHVILIY